MRSNRQQILSLSGGGIRGLYTASILASCEEKFSVLCRDRFDLVSGTSVGALLAAGVSAGVDASTLSEKMTKWGPVIFEAAPDGIADYYLKDFDFPLIIPTVNYTHSKIEIFKSGGVSGQENSRNISISDAIIASASAPTFFPMKKIATDDYIDGGILANAPDVISLLEFTGLRQISLDSTYMLSIGTTGRRHGSRVSALTQRPGEKLAIDQARLLLSGRYYRIDQEPKIDQEKYIKNIDQASQSSLATLRSLADDTWHEIETDARLRDFFAR